jgi:hypothetical protein
MTKPSNKGVELTATSVCSDLWQWLSASVGRHQLETSAHMERLPLAIISHSHRSQTWLWHDQS